MKRLVRLLAVILVIAFVVLQFFQPEKNRSEITQDHIFKQEQVPEQMQTLLKAACLDCHSNTTTYLWYHNIVPVAWMVEEHVIDGKDELNFSEWEKMDVYDKITKLEEICQEVERGQMPLKSYKLMHPKAKLSDEQIAELCAWTSKLSEEWLAKAMKE